MDGLCPPRHDPAFVLVSRRRGPAVFHRQPAGLGQSPEAVTGHAFFRAFFLVLLGIFLRSAGHKQTNFTFEDTLTQIGLGYGFLYLLALRSVRVQWIAFALILAGYWLAFALWPLPGPNFDWAHAGVTADFVGNATGFAAHWNKNTNLAWAFDTWFLNLFPREKPFLFNQGGYATLSFIPTLGTMILGLIAGEILRRARPNAERCAGLSSRALPASLSDGCLAQWVSVRLSSAFGRHRGCSSAAAGAFSRWRRFISSLIFAAGVAGLFRSWSSA